MSKISFPRYYLRKSGVRFSSNRCFPVGISIKQAKIFFKNANLPNCSGFGALAFHVNITAAQDNIWDPTNAPPLKWTSSVNLEKKTSKNFLLKYWVEYMSQSKVSRNMISCQVFMPCPFIGPKWFYTIKIVLDKLFWLGPNHFVQVQIRLFRTDFNNLEVSKMIWTWPKLIRPVQNNWYSTKMI